MSGSGAASLIPVVATEALREQGLEACVGVPPIVLEIGFGRADLILLLAADAPERCFLGVEVSRKRVEKASRCVQQRKLANVRLVHAPAQYMLERVLPENSVGECWINCPDPWPKKRHHKRRLLNGEFLHQLGAVMVPGAVLHVSTDHPGYANWIRDAFSQAGEFQNLHAPEPWSTEPPNRPHTAYEAEWLADGRTLTYFDYRMGTR